MNKYNNNEIEDSKANINAPWAVKDPVERMINFEEEARKIGVSNAIYLFSNRR